MRDAGRKEPCEKGEEKKKKKKRKKERKKEKKRKAFSST